MPNSTTIIKFVKLFGVEIVVHSFMTSHILSIKLLVNANSTLDRPINYFGYCAFLPQTINLNKPAHTLEGTDYSVTKN